VQEAYVDVVKRLDKFFQESKYPLFVPSFRGNTGGWTSSANRIMSTGRHPRFKIRTSPWQIGCSSSSAFCR
jgi:hypothetical protein